MKVTYLGIVPFCKNDGGRKEAGYKGHTGDCVIRAIAIAAKIPYKTVYKELSQLSGTTVRNGVERRFYDQYLKAHGWKWMPCVKIGTGCQVHLHPDELPTAGAYILRLSRHVAAFVDGVLHDDYDCSRNGKRCVYGYYYKEMA